MGQQRFIEAQAAVLAKHGLAAESRFIDVVPTGERAHVLVTGSGPPLVMLNGAGTPAAMLAPLIAHLDGFRIYAIDHPAHGLSGPWPGFGGDLDGNAIAYVTAVLDGLDIELAVFLGNSFGSRVIFRLALATPNRVTSAIHVGCPAGALGTSAPLPMRLMATRLGPLLNRMTPPSRFQVTQLAKMVKEHPLSAEITELLIATESQEHFAATLHDIHRAIIRLRGARPDAVLAADQLAAVDHPVQLIWGRDDPFGSPEVGRRMAEAIPNAELHVVPGGHAPWLKHGAEVAAHARVFLNATAPR